MSNKVECCRFISHENCCLDLCCSRFFIFFVPDNGATNLFGYPLLGFLPARGAHKREICLKHLCPCWKLPWFTAHNAHFGAKYLLRPHLITIKLKPFDILEISNVVVAVKSLLIWNSKCACFYTHARLWLPPSFLAVNHHNAKNWVPFILTHNLWLIFMWMKQKKLKKVLKKNSKWPTQKNWVFNIAKSWAISAKISQICPWDSRIDWWEGHQCDSTYMAVRLSDVSPKKG